MPQYVKKIINENPRIVSGRKNFLEQHKRIINTIKLIKKYCKIKE